MNRLSHCLYGIVTAGLSIIMGTSLAQASRLVVPPNLTLSSPAVYDTVEVNSGGTLTVDAPLTVNALMIVRSGGFLGHSWRHLTGLELNVSGLLEVEGGNSGIDVSSAGLCGGFNGSSDWAGESYNGSGVIQHVYQEMVGGSYGGYGGRTTWLPYGVLENPVYLGSGGSDANNAGGGEAGRGGGLVRIVAQDVVLNGRLWANGQNGVNCGYGSGGSGGGIRLEILGTLSGTGSIQAIGGNACGAAVGSGGGGRIAIYYNTLGAQNPIDAGNVLARGGSTVNTGGAGTIFLKPTEGSGTLLVDNGGVVSSLATPLRTQLSLVHEVRARTATRIELDTAHLLTSWAERIGLQNATLVAADTIRLEGTTLFGVGTVSAPLVNNGHVAPGNGVGQLVCAAGYKQTGGGELISEIASLTQHDHLHVSGTAKLDGLVTISYLNGFTPPLDSRYSLISFGTRSGDFATLGGTDSVAAVAYQDTMAVLIEGRDLSDRSTADPVLVISPSGTTPFRAILRDSQGQPLVGTTNAWLDLSTVTGLTGCTPVPHIVYPDEPSDVNGEVHYTVKAGRCTSDPAFLVTSHGSIAQVPIRSLDHNGGLVVNAFDFVGDVCNDYNNDGLVNSLDWDFFARYLGQTCITNPANYFPLDLFTRPGPDSLFVGATIQVCARVRNTALEPAVLDSLVFTAAGWGIAQPWTRFARIVSTPIGAGESLVLSVPFTIPSDAPRHGCWRVAVYPHFVGNDKLLAEVGGEPTAIRASTSLSAGADLEGLRLDLPKVEVQKNADSRPDPCQKVPCPSGSLQPDYDGEIRRAVEFFHSPAASNCVPADILRRIRDAVPLGTNPWGPNQCYRNTGDCRYPCGESGTGIEVNWLGYPPFGCNDPTCTAYHELLHKGVTPDNTPWPFRWPSGVADRECYMDFMAKCLSGHSCPNDLNGCSPRYDNVICSDNPGCQRGPGLAGRADQQGAARAPVRQRLRAERELSSTLTDTTAIPIGSAFGSHLRLFTRGFIPAGWSYAVSDTGWVTVPDTIAVTITHPVPISCRDTCRVVVYAYDSGGNYAGDAEALVVAKGPLGDVDWTGTEDAIDIVQVERWLIEGDPLPIHVDAMDTNCDGSVDLGDLTRLVDAVYAGGSLDCRSPGFSPTYSVTFLQGLDSTTVLLDASRPIRGLQLVLVGAGSGQPVSALPPAVDLLSYGTPESLGVLIADLDGNVPISGPIAFRVAGTYGLVAGRHADLDHHSGDVAGVQPPFFVRGDVDANGETNISDPIYNLAYQFAGGPAPVALDAADDDDSGEINISDPIYSLSYQFAGGPPPAAPFPACGPDVSWDGLSAASFPPCGTSPRKRPWPAPAFREHERLVLQPEAGAPGDTLAFPLVLETGMPLLGFEGTVTYDADRLVFAGLRKAQGLPDMAFLSAGLAETPGKVRFGCVPDLALLRPLAAGKYELGRLCFVVLPVTDPAGEPGPLQLVGARLVDGARGELVLPAGAPVAARHAGDNGSVPPVAFGLHLSNPYRAQSAIQLRSSAGRVSAEVGIYDVNGRRVRRVLSGDLPAEGRVLSWDGHADTGQDAAAGVYYLKVEMGRESLSRTIVFLQ